MGVIAVQVKNGEVRTVKQLENRHIFSEQTVCADAQLNATVCHFADIISLRRRHNSLGPIRVVGEYLFDLKFYLK